MFQIYLLTTLLPNLKEGFILLLGLAGMAFFVSIVGFLFTFNTGTIEEKCRKAGKYCLIFLAVIFPTYLALPSEKQAYLMVGGTYLTNAEAIKDLPEEAAKAANAWLKSVTEAGEKK